MVILDKLTSPYHPQANSLDERFNQTFKSALEKLVSEKQNDFKVSIYVSIWHSVSTSDSSEDGKSSSIGSFACLPNIK
jgi:stress response protein YsnF